MAKVHLRANKGETMAIFARCASKLVNGKVRFNGRQSYRYMASAIVDFEGFRETPKADRCAHCLDVALDHLNRTRRARGEGPVTHIFKEERA